MTVPHSQLTTMLLAHFAQATLFGGFVGLLLLLAGRLSARRRWWIAAAGLLKFVLPLGALGLVLPGRAIPVLSGGWLAAWVVSPAGPAGRSGPAFPLTSLVTIGWLAGAVLCLLWGGLQYGRLRRRLRVQRAALSPDWQIRLARLAVASGVNPARVTGWEIPDGLPIGVAGIFRSRIHVPRELLHTLSVAEAESVFLHELAHVARRDNLRRLLQSLIVGLCWFHPLAWWLHRRLLLESERACDESVVRLAPNAAAYAQGLFKSARFALGLGVPGFSGMARSGLSARIAAILQPNPRKDPIMLRLILALGVLAGFALTSGATPTDPSSSTEAMKGLDAFPQPVFQPRPIYPEALRADGIEGRAEISIIVDKDGNVRSPLVVTATRPEFGEAALAAVSQWKFTPGVKGGRKVNTRVAIPIVFTPGKH